MLIHAGTFAQMAATSRIRTAEKLQQTIPGAPPDPDAGDYDSIRDTCARLSEMAQISDCPAAQSVAAILKEDPPVKVCATEYDRGAFNAGRLGVIANLEGNQPARQALEWMISGQDPVKDALSCMPREQKCYIEGVHHGLKMLISDNLAR